MTSFDMKNMYRKYQFGGKLHFLVARAYSIRPDIQCLNLL